MKNIFLLFICLFPAFVFAQVKSTLRIELPNTETNFPEASSSPMVRCVVLIRPSPASAAMRRTSLLSERKRAAIRMAERVRYFRDDIRDACSLDELLHRPLQSESGETSNEWMLGLWSDGLEVVEAAYDSDLHDRSERMLGSLSSRERAVIEMRFGFGDEAVHDR